jgi:cystathionine beta-lyase family protein involved in aluminum resistance
MFSSNYCEIWFLASQADIFNVFSKVISMTNFNATDFVEAQEKRVKDRFDLVDNISLVNQQKVLSAFKEFRLADDHFHERTGYGISDPARELIDNVYAKIFDAEAAAVRMHIVSGTHAIAAALFGNLKSGDTLVCVTGKPYDTLAEVIGYSASSAYSLKSMGVKYKETDISQLVDVSQAIEDKLSSVIDNATTMVHIQKSCGYNFIGKSLNNNQILSIINAVKKINANTIILVDNCYGEFVEEREPTSFGADLVAGSLIKNPGGGLAITGGYIAGKSRYVEAALNRLTAPGIGGHLGILFNQNRLLLQGLFIAPSVVANSIKGAILFAQVFNELGFEVNPKPLDKRADIIQGIKFADKEKLIGFLRLVQAFSPVNSYVKPEPANMPGYEDKVIMAGGTFIAGSTIELSADGPLRPPYAAYIQGGLTYLHVKSALIGILGEGNFVR